MGYLMGHFMEEDLADVVPTTLVDKFPANGNFPLVVIPGSESFLHFPNGEQRSSDPVPDRFRKQPKGVFPFCRKAF